MSEEKIVITLQEDWDVELDSKYLVIFKKHLGRFYAALLLLFKTLPDEYKYCSKVEDGSITIFDTENTFISKLSFINGINGEIIVDITKEKGYNHIHTNLYNNILKLYIIIKNNIDINLIDYTTQFDNIKRLHF